VLGQCSSSKQRNRVQFYYKASHVNWKKIVLENGTHAMVEETCCSSAPALATPVDGAESLLKREMTFDCVKERSLRGKESVVVKRAARARRRPGVDIVREDWGTKLVEFLTQHAHLVFVLITALGIAPECGVQAECHMIS
jgi:hypothetical protein